MTKNTETNFAFRPRKSATAVHLRAAMLATALCGAAVGVAHGQSGTPPPGPPPVPPTEAGLVAKGAKRLGAVEFETLYVGNTLTGTTSDGQPFHVYVESKTTLRMEFEGKRSQLPWHAGKDGEFCSVDDKETTCTREYRHDTSIYSFNPDGTHGGTASLRPGNPEKL